MRKESYMPNWCDLGSDYPSKEVISQLEKEQLHREIEERLESLWIEKYLQSHPSASYAEAIFKRGNTNGSHCKTAKYDRVCRNCGASGLKWVETSEGWRLYTKMGIHACTKNT